MDKHVCKIIDGAALAEKIKDGIVKEIIRLDKNSLAKGRPGLVFNRPNLAIILVGGREDSLLYVDMKEREARKVGIDTHVYKCPEDIPQKDILDMIKSLNNDPLIDGILVQLPLPKKYDTNAIIGAIDPEKDADLFHPKNLEKMLSPCDSHHLLPPVCGAVLAILDDIKFESGGKKACVAANSRIFGRTMAKVLSCRQIEAEAVVSESGKLASKTVKADLLVTAIGKPGIIKGGMIKKGAVVIDIGISKEGKKVRGDVDMEEAIKRASHLTPVPGGVGPMTIAMLFKNTLELHKRKKSVD